MAQSLELADQNARTLRGSDTALHQFYQTRTQCKGQQGQGRGRSHARPQIGGKLCYRCGGTDHLAATCCFVDFTCRLAKSGGSHTSSLSQQSSRTQRLSTVDASEVDLPMFCLGSKRTDPIVVDVSVGGIPVSMEVVQVLLCP